MKKLSFLAIIEWQGPDYFPAFNNKKTEIDTLKNGFQTLDNKLCRTVIPERRKTNNISHMSAPNLHLKNTSRTKNGG